MGISIGWMITKPGVVAYWAERVDKSTIKTAVLGSLGVIGAVGAAAAKDALVGAKAAGVTAADGLGAAAAAAFSLIDPEWLNGIPSGQRTGI
jgi:hypothetical protein